MRVLPAMMALLAAIWATASHAAEPTVFRHEGATRQLDVASTTDLVVIRPLIEAFVRRNPTIEVRYTELTTNELYTEAAKACAAPATGYDFVLSSAMDLQVKLVNDGCARPVEPAVADLLPDHATWRSELFGLTFEPAVIVYNKERLSSSDAPKDHFDLLDLLREPGRFDGRIGTYDIAESGVGYLFATQDEQRSFTWGRLIEAFGRNNVRLYCCTADILHGVLSGELDLGYNVLGSYALALAREEEALGIVIPSDYTLVMTRSAYVPRNADNPTDAVSLMSFMLGPEGRSILNEQSLLLSSVDGAEALYRVAGLPETAGRSFRTISLSPSLVVDLDAMKRALFLKQWDQALGERPQ